MSGHRILTIAHGHPLFSYGGGEIAAYTLNEGYKQHKSVETAVFLGAHPESDSGKLGICNKNEYLWEQKCADYFYFNTHNIGSLTNNFIELLNQIQPDIVHLHHGIHLGYELIQIIKNFNPDIFLFLTLHEFIPICINNGHMIQPNGQLCYKADVHACHRCFPDRSVEDIWLRSRRFRHFLALPNVLIAPSEFLRQRYLDWGIEAKRIVTLENALRPLPQLLPRQLKKGEHRNRFAFFGQIHPAKGLQTLLDAILLIPPKQRQNISLEIHGAHLENQQEGYQKEIFAKLQLLQNNGCVRFIGPYSPVELPMRMAGIDWVVVPSIWWENSPVVIQEAFALGRPVLTGNIGGMAEKTRHNIDGLHVQARNPQAWADAILECCGNDRLWDKLHAGIKKPQSPKEVARKHIALLEEKI